METMLVREPLAGEFVESGYDLELANDAEQLFEYRRLKQAIEEVSPGSPQDQFVKAMNELDIRPFNAEAVERYKQEEVRKAEWNDHKIFWSNAMGFTSFFCFAIAAIMAIVGITKYFVVGTGTPFGAIFAGFFAAFVVFLTICLGLDTMTVYWRTCFIKEYERQIPEYVLQTAVNLKKKCPDLDLQFQVDELLLIERNSTLGALLLDPFLRVRAPNGQWHYIEVWGEPGFDRKREI